MANQSDVENKSPEKQAHRILERIISFGTVGYDQQTRRRLRLINSVILILNTAALGLFFVVSVFFLMSGKSPFSIGNLASLVACVIISVAPFLHRFSDIAAPVYLLLAVLVLNTIHSFNQGAAQGSHVIFLLALACAPLFLGPNRRFLSFFSMLCMAVAYFYVEYYAPTIGVNIQGRSDADIQMIKSLQLLMVIFGIYFIVSHSVVVAENAMEAVQKEQDRSEGLLRNILPDSIALRLKSEPAKIIADRHRDVMVIFVDLVDFTPKASRLSAEALVQFLNRIFSEFDKLVEEHELEKIKTIGDAYMVVAGIPNVLPDNAGMGAEFALAVIEKTQELSKVLDGKIQVRIGMQTGDVVAGVIGSKKFAYDVWGDTVNTAARMESSGAPNRIQVTEAVKFALENRYEFAERGFVKIKGKGPMKLFYLMGRA